MRTSENVSATETITVGQHELKKVEQIKYLGTILIQKNECQKEIQQKIKMENKCFFAVGKLLSSRVLLKEVQIQLYLTIIRQESCMVLQYWTLRKTKEDKLLAFERKVLRKMYGLIYDQGFQGWRKRHNQELMEVFNRRNIVNEIKQNKLKWAGHA